MKKSKKIFARLALFSFIALFAFANVAYAYTKSDLNFCQQPGVLRTMKIIGLVINVVKIALPVLIVGTAMFKFVNVIISGKEEDMKEAAMTVIKKVVAGMLIFIIPGVIHFVFTNVVNANNSSNFTKCESCLNQPKSCSIPASGPSIYTD